MENGINTPSNMTEQDGTSVKAETVTVGPIELIGPGFLTRRSYDEWRRYIEEKNALRQASGRILCVQVEEPSVSEQA